MKEVSHEADVKGQKLGAWGSLLMISYRHAQHISTDNFSLQVPIREHKRTQTRARSVAQIRFDLSIFSCELITEE